MKKRAVFLDRDGTIVEIVGREFDSKGGPLWYEVKIDDRGAASHVDALQGWVPELELDIFASRQQAERSLASRGAK